MFRFSGPVLTSKSWLNRALIIRQFNPHLRLETDSQSDDVIALKSALSQIGKSTEFELGMGGTSFRFFAFAISRFPGEWTLRAHPRLLARPQSDIVALLLQLGVRSELSSQSLRIFSGGWKPGSAVKTKADQSSQFVSGLLLSAWNLEAPLELEIKKPVTSYGYLNLTFEMLMMAGMNLQIIDTDNSLRVKIPEMQRADLGSLVPELDISSAFSLAAAAVVGGEAQLTNWNSQSLQPDAVFLKLFDDMKIAYQQSANSLFITKHSQWNGVTANLNTSPDLFPVLAVLCALAKGNSVLRGATHLKNKESDRIQKTHELLNIAGFITELLPDGIKIAGLSSSQDKTQKLLFDPDLDHRMAMAAALLKIAGYNLEIANPEAVNKSYPEFWKDIGL